MPKLYETDYFAWTKNAAAALREGRVRDIDLTEVAEEIEDLGKSERRAFESALSQLFLHKLKWDYQPNLRGRSWEVSIQKQIRILRKILRENPSFAPLLEQPDFIAEIYGDAVLDAMAETGLEASTFPAACPYDATAILGEP
ncbi:MAG: DUF29 domain-containing protein [Bryobacteraceae bacterium]|jgi:hypothetical protein